MNTFVAAMNRPGGAALVYRRALPGRLPLQLAPSSAASGLGACGGGSRLPPAASLLVLA
jgi:hypothetical protein